MFRIDTPTNVAVLPAPEPIGDPGFFTKGTPGPGTPVPATNFSADWCNSIQEELCNAIEGFGVALNKASRTQLRDILLGSIGGGFRKKLQANTNFYVRADGNNANNGLANNAGGAWLTLQRAFDVLATLYDFNGFQATINVGNGTFAGGTMFGACLGQVSPILITGSGAANTTINRIGVSAAANVTVSGFKFSNLAGDAFVVTTYAFGNVGAGMEFGAMGASNAHVYTNGLGQVSFLNNYTISGGGGDAHCRLLTGYMSMNAITVTVTGTPNFTGSFVSLNFGSVFGAQVGTSFVGGATGKRYDAQLNSVINTSGGGGSFFPGNSAGTTATGGQYT